MKSVLVVQGMQSNLSGSVLPASLTDQQGYISHKIDVQQKHALLLELTPVLA